MGMKKIIMSAVAGASMLVAFAGTGSAAQIDLNIYGSSAQYLYWNAAAPGILAAQGCTNIQQAKLDNKNAITKATCGVDTVYYRVTSKASFDGILSLEGNDTYAAAGPTSEKCSAGDPGDPGVALRPFYRKMVDENSTLTWVAAGSAVPASSTATLKCQRVTLGASDVAGASFTQSSSGNLLGPLGGAVISRSFSGISTTSPVALTAYNPLVVPFAFFSNTSVKKCTDKSGNPLAWASCVADPGQVTTTQSTISNMPRMMAAMIFSGQAFLWTDLGKDYVTGLNVVACLRHAGSGTAATLDYAVMNGKWGAPMASAQSTLGPYDWFNDGSSDEMNCVNGSGAYTGAGAVGYSDADQAIGANTVRLTYNGEAASRVNIRNGRYDFWTTEWVYENPSAPAYAQTHPHVSAMMTYAANAANIPALTTWGPDKTQYWASTAEMNYMKASDQLYPAYVGCTSCQTP